MLTWIIILLEQSILANIQQLNPCIHGLVAGHPKCNINNIDKGLVMVKSNEDYVPLESGGSFPIISLL